MSAIITDQIRILNAKNFVAGIGATSNSYYSFIGFVIVVSKWFALLKIFFNHFIQTNLIIDASFLVVNKKLCLAFTIEYFW